jgi:hypothetical protein
MKNIDSVIIVSNDEDWEMLFINGENVLETHHIDLLTMMYYLPTGSQGMTLTVYEYVNKELEDIESDELYREVFITKKYTTFEQLEPLLQSDDFEKYGH